ncbi:unnamed protein product [Menidia menidia]|uniref:(Atlantic silverside) hypothetical protein n=1 Tax=Menidia menidia TaxID=238744 RepID=A0A8S4AWR9_9TELE|nr:unnamed protein product [Menidia menidia]
MAPLKPQDQTRGAKRRADAKRKAAKTNVRSNISKASDHNSETPEHKEKGRRDSTGPNRRKTSEAEREERSQKGRKRKTGKGKTTECTSPTAEEDGETGKPPPKAAPLTEGGVSNKPPSKSEKKSAYRPVKSEDESGSEAGGSEEGREEALSEGGEEHSSSRGPAETRGGPDTEPSDTQSPTEPSASEDSDRDPAESSRDGSEAGPGALTGSGEEGDGRPEAGGGSGSDSDADEHRMKHQDSQEPAPAPKTPRQQTQPPPPPKEPKYKMFKRSKADKQEKKRAKIEKKKLEKEAKQRAKIEKKNKKKQKYEKSGATTKEVQIPTDISQRDIDGEEDEDEPGLEKNLTGQSQTRLLKAAGKGRPSKATLGPPGQQGAAGAAGGGAQSKVQAASAGRTADQSEEEPSQCEATEEESSKSQEPLIPGRTNMRTLRRMSAWIQKKLPQKLNFKKKFSALTKAIGLSHWLSVRAIKHKQGARRPRGLVLRQRMAMRVASRTSLVSKKGKSLPDDRVDTDGVSSEEKGGQAGGAAGPAQEKEIEAKYAVVLPRMNRLGKAKKTEASQANPGPEVPSSPPGEQTTSQSRPPQPGAKLVLPVKPDLSLLKSMRALPGGSTPAAHVREGSSGPQDPSQRPPAPEEAAWGSSSEPPEADRLLAAARGKLKPSQVKLGRIPGITAGRGPGQPQGPEPVKEGAGGEPRSEPVLDREAGVERAGGGSLYEEEADREVARLMGEGGAYSPPAPPAVHWAGNPRMSGDPQVCGTL